MGIGILAGGGSRRMGTDKARLRLEGEEFLRRIAGELEPLGPVWISAGEAGRYSDLPYPVVADVLPDVGPMEGIRRLLTVCERRWMFVCATDMPCVRKELVRYLSAFADPAYDCVMPLDERGPHPLGALYSRELLPALDAAIRRGRHKLLEFLQSVRTRPVLMKHSPFDPSVLLNVNTREEYRALLEMPAPRRRSPPVFCVSGVKNSGKTGLILRLLAELRPRFPNIGVIKHDGHDFVMDREGTDTRAFLEAGVAKTAIFSDHRAAVLSGAPPFWVEEFIAGMGEMDLILLEGFKGSGYPKIEVVRRGISTRPVCEGPSLTAVASDLTPEHFSGLNVPVLPLEDTAAIAQAVTAELTRRRWL